MHFGFYGGWTVTLTTSHRSTRWDFIYLELFLSKLRKLHSKENNTRQQDWVNQSGPMNWPWNFQVHCVSFLLQEDSSLHSGSPIHTRYRLSTSFRKSCTSCSFERALGAQWNISFDLFGFTILIKDRPATRRGILSIVSSAYDPLGCHNLHTHHQTDLHDLCCKK